MKPIFLFAFSLNRVVIIYKSILTGKQNIIICIKSLSKIFLNRVILYIHSNEITVKIQKIISIIFFLFILPPYLLPITYVIRKLLIICNKLSNTLYHILQNLTNILKVV